MNKAIIKIKNLSKKYNNNIKVLNNLNLTFEEGKIYSIIGPSGSGKSTLLNILSLIDRPTSGSLFINESKVNFNELINNDKIRARNIGIVYQDKNLLPDFTTLENIYLPYLAINNSLLDSVKNGKKLSYQEVKLKGLPYLERL